MSNKVDDEDEDLEPSEEEVVDFMHSMLREVADYFKPDTFKGKNISYENINKNDPCPCGSKQKFKKCHQKQL